MTTASLREQMHQQLDALPDEIVHEVAEFMAFVLARRRMTQPYADWTDDDWQQFALAQFVRETDNDVEYTLDDAREV